MPGRGRTVAGRTRTIVRTAHPEGKTTGAGDAPRVRRVSQPFSFEPYPSAGPTAPPGPEPRTADVVVTVIELVVLALAALLVTALAALLGLFVEASEGEGSSGALMAFVLVPTWGLWLVALVVSVVLMTRKLLAFWVPLAALVIWVVLVLVVVNLA